ncbi:WD40 repeat-like protein [Obba rivulosa]|uniref:WD40 repeat-like protein n=2 Tax=Obba rivulosa TaxID=1052685 RepID=A0A8E2AH96_9APHY|nr:WD40 repeat-like protein [Obba rivulosa]
MSPDYTPLPAKSPFASRGPVPTPLEAIGLELPAREAGGSSVLAGHIGAVHSVAFSPDGSELASASEDGTVGTWDITSGDMTAVLRGHQRKVVAVTYSPNGLYIASGSDDHTVWLWMTPTKKAHVILKGHTDRISAVEFAPDNLVVASASHDGSVRFWDMQGSCIRRLQVTSGLLRGIMCICFSPYRQLLLCNRDGKMQLLSPYTGPVLMERQLEDNNDFHSAVWLPHGSQFVTASENKLQRWDVPKYSVDLEYVGHTARITSLSFSFDGTFIASGSLDHTTIIWLAQTGKPVARFYTGPVMSCAFSPSDYALVIGLFDGTMRYVKDVRMMNAVTGTEDHILDLRLASDIAMPTASEYLSLAHTVLLLPNSHADTSPTLARGADIVWDNFPVVTRTCFLRSLLPSAGSLFRLRKRQSPKSQETNNINADTALHAKKWTNDDVFGIMWPLKQSDVKADSSKKSQDGESTIAALSRHPSTSSSSSGTLAHSQACAKPSTEDDCTSNKREKFVCVRMQSGNVSWDDDGSHGCYISCGFW